MIGNKLDEYRNSEPMIGTGHRMATNRAKVSYIRRRIRSPESEEAFWSIPTQSTDFSRSIRRQTTGSTADRIRDKIIKYCDLQIPYTYEEEYEDTVCLCSQWCNWNAFFYYNPILRFLLVQHNKLYMKNRTNIADMYLFFCNTGGSIGRTEGPNARNTCPSAHWLR